MNGISSWQIIYPLWLISYLYDNCFVAILGDREYLQKNIAETVVLQIPEAFYQRLAIAATD